MGDFVDNLLATQVSGRATGHEHMDENQVHEEIGRLVSVGKLDEIGAMNLRRMISAATGNHAGVPPSPPFQRSSRDTSRRAPLGMVEDGTGANFFSLPAVVGSTTTMRGKVSRTAHINRLLIVPSAPGVVIESLKIGDVDQNLASGVPVELYGTTALTDSEPDNFDPLGPGLDLVITLKNTVAVAITGTIGSKALVKR